MVMFPKISLTGARNAFHLLHDIANRARDLEPAWDGVADDVFAFQRRYWASNPFGQPAASTIARDHRGGRDPRMMYVTGGLQRSATVRGAPGQIVSLHRDYLLIGVTHGLAAIHEERGRKVLEEPGQREARKYAVRVGEYILHGRA